MKQTIQTVVFDADGTLMKGENPYMRLASLLNCQAELEEKVQAYLQGKLDYLELVTWQSELYKQAYFRTYGVKPRAGDLERLLEVPKIRRNTAMVIRRLTLEGKKVFILSSGLRFLIRELSRAYIPPEAVYANRLLYDISGEFVTIYVEVMGDKVEALNNLVSEHGLEWRSLAYVGDNAFDLPIFKHIQRKGGQIFLLEDSKSDYKLPDSFDRSTVQPIRSVREILSVLDTKPSIQLARTWQELLRGKRAVLVCGLPATGKTTIATQIEQSAQFHWLNTDQIRVGVGATSKKKYGGPLGKEARARIRKETYSELMTQAGEVLEKGKNAVLDGTFMDEYRDETMAILGQKLKKSEILLVVVKTDEQMVMQRKKARMTVQEQELFATMFQTWKQDLLMGNYWYPRVGDYPGVEMVEVVNGELAIKHS